MGSGFGKVRIVPSAAPSALHSAASVIPGTAIGHALELAGDNKTVVWSNPASGLNYRLTPVRKRCRCDRRVKGVP